MEQTNDPFSVIIGLVRSESPRDGPMTAQGGAHAERSSRVRNPGLAVKDVSKTPKAWPEIRDGLIHPS